MTERALGVRAGIGLREPHVAEVLATRPAVPWFEIHTENYLGGGPRRRAIEAVRRDYPLALHGVGLSLGSAAGVDERHLVRLARLIERIEPALVSEHLAWSISGGTYLNHLLPLPYTEEALGILRRNVDRVQERLGRRILVENPSGYLRFRQSTIAEADFLAELAQRTGCGILCDVNNVYVTCRNLGLDPRRYLAALPARAIGEIHLAGHAVNETDGGIVLIDDHGSRVSDAVWELHAEALERFGPVPTLIEWDTCLPSLEVLRAEAAHADRCRATALADDHDRAA
jgi:hypothetical protein